MSAFRRIRTILMFTAFPAILLISACARESAPPQPASPQFSALATPAVQLEQVKANLKEIKQAVAKEGNYKCCIKPSCNWCLLHEGECACRKNLLRDEEVCPGCGLGWHNGQGRVDDVKAGEVKWTISHSHDHEEGDDDHTH